MNTEIHRTTLALSFSTPFCRIFGCAKNMILLLDMSLMYHRKTKITRSTIQWFSD